MGLKPKYHLKEEVVMESQTITIIIQILVLLIGIIVGRYLIPFYRSHESKIQKIIDDTVNVTHVIDSWAYKFVTYYAREDISGADKFDAAVQNILSLLKSRGLEFDEDAVKASVQKAYEEAIGHYDFVSIEKPVENENSNVKPE